MKDNGKFFFGVIVILIGLLLLLEQANIFPPLAKYLWEFVALFWPLILIFFGAKLLINRNNVPGIILLVLGLAFLSTNLFSWNFFGVLWPVILITIGLSLLFKNESKPGESKSSSEDRLNDTVVFWGLERKVSSKAFQGGEFNVAFGGLELDLSGAKIHKDGAIVHINCAFGGVEIIVPKDCRIKTSGTAVLGGWESTVKEREVKTPVLEISGSALFGGVEIREK